MAHGDLLLLDLAELFAVNVYPGRRWRRGFPDDLGHCTEKMGGAEQDRWIALLFHVIQKELRVSMALLCGLGEPVLCCGIVRFHVLPQKIQLAQEVLGL